MRLNQLQAQLAELKKSEAIAQTREQVLNEERSRLLVEVTNLYKDLRKLNLFSEEELTPANLQNVVNKLQEKIDVEVAEVIIPPELR